MRVVPWLNDYLRVRYNTKVHIISRKALRLFWEQHPDSEGPLLRWFKIVRRTRFRNLVELRAVFPSADPVNSWVVFNIHGAKYRLVTSIHFNRGKVYIRHVLRHAEYSRGSWKR
jgi:mRNA interferase HigB